VTEEHDRTRQVLLAVDERFKQAYLELVARLARIDTMHPPVPVSMRAGLRTALRTIWCGDESDGERSLSDDLNELVRAGVIPVLHHAPLRPQFAALEDPDDPDPRWCCHDERDEMYHCHGKDPEEAVAGLLRWARAGRLPDPSRSRGR
jgi:hypothetical protein